MNKINYFKKFIIYSRDVIADMNNMHLKKFTLWVTIELAWQRGESGVPVNDGRPVYCTLWPCGAMEGGTTTLSFFSP
jgi:hypothetical protein